MDIADSRLSGKSPMDTSFSNMPFDARIYYGPTDAENLDLANEWMMIVRPKEQYATFYRQEEEKPMGPGRCLPDPTQVRTRFLVAFADVEEDGTDDHDEHDEYVTFPKYTEALEEECGWYKVGSITLYKKTTAAVIRNVGKIAPKMDNEWTERVILVC